ncbi:hypothetical protein DL93DRAFT_321455 [Clavulina sp. PMI_390]|nr:hypothetical protein DL93DRAFT_321455 [Clavulina sp. PMI_390]
MAKSAPARLSSSDSEDLGEHYSPKKARASQNGATSKSTSAKQVPVDDDEESDKGGDGDDDEEEYEIEEILDVRVGGVPEAPDEIAYFVSWKNYGEDDNSWTTESNAGGAQVLINKFWKKRARAEKPSRDTLLERHQAKKDKKGARKSMVKKNRISSVNDASSEDLGAMASKPSSSATKNGRTKAAASPASPPEKAKRRRSEANPDAMDVDEKPEGDDAPAPKKRKSTYGGRNNTKPPPGQYEPVAPPADGDLSGANDEEAEVNHVKAQEQLEITTMKKFGHLTDWSETVVHINTVERREKDKLLQVHFRSHEGDDCLATSAEFAQRAPYKLINFYESNLKWRVDGSS